MILTHKNDPTKTLGIDNDIKHPGWISLDVTCHSKFASNPTTMIIDIGQIKSLINHLQDMVQKYEGKKDNRSSA